MTEQARLIAYYELTQAKAKYCRTLDTRDWKALAALMTPDIEFGMSDGQSEPHMTVGRDETLALLQSLVAGSRTAHHVHTPEIDLNEDEASVIWAVQDRAVFDNGMSVTGYGHYAERWVRREGAWRLASLRLSHLLTDVDQDNAGVHMWNEGGGGKPFLVDCASRAAQRLVSLARRCIRSGSAAASAAVCGPFPRRC